jgi:hypothetical protein
VREPIDPIDLVGVDPLLTDEGRGWRDRTRALVVEHVLDDVERWHDR